MEAIEQVPKTALDIFRLLPEGTLCEVIDNVLYMSPAPKYTHQRVVGALAVRLSDYTEITKTGEIIVGPLDVYFETLLSAVQPDLIFISNENRHVLNDDGYIYGTPDLVVEILSSDKKRDTVKKKSLYERAGVKEYFIVNPADSNVQCYTLKENNYILTYEAEGIFKSQILNLEFKF